MNTSNSVPSYLASYASTYADDPRAAALEWFREAKYGLFMHFGLYSLLGRHEWVQLRETIRPGAYAELAHAFKAGRFDAEAIADFAVACGMRYLNITTRHHDGFCLWPSRETSFHAGNTPCGRDVLAELAAAAEPRGLGLFFYYSHGRDWKHPHAPNNDRWGGNARPRYDPPETTYACGEAHNLDYYLDFMTAQIAELLTDYGPVAGIWLDGIAVPLTPLGPDGNPREAFDPRTDGDAFKCQALYDHIHALQPQTLVSYKQGYLGTEDFFAPEHKVYNRFGDAADNRPGEVCTTSGGGWGYTAGHAYCTADELWETLRQTRAGGYNLLMNVGPLPDGSLPEPARETLLAVGERIRREGMPSE